MVQTARGDSERSPIGLRVGCAAERVGIGNVMRGLPAAFAGKWVERFSSAVLVSVAAKTFSLITSFASSPCSWTVIDGMTEREMDFGDLEHGLTSRLLPRLSGGERIPVFRDPGTADIAFFNWRGCVSTNLDFARAFSSMQRLRELRTPPLSPDPRPRLFAKYNRSSLSSSEPRGVIVSRAGTWKPSLLFKPDRSMFIASWLMGE
jgi:hypothetical protein